MPDPVVAIVARVTTPNQLSFQLRKGEFGISVFEPFGVEPPLTETEILEAFRPGSIIVYRTVAEIAALGLDLAISEGAEFLPVRLRDSHREIVPGPRMGRAEFKSALKGLES